MEYFRHARPGHSCLARRRVGTGSAEPDFRRSDRLQGDVVAAVVEHPDTAGAVLPDHPRRHLRTTGAGQSGGRDLGGSASIDGAIETLNAPRCRMPPRSFSSCSPLLGRVPEGLSLQAALYFPPYRLALVKPGWSVAERRRPSVNPPAALRSANGYYATNRSAPCPGRARGRRTRARP